MTLSEFKAWFEGFSEGIDKAPTEKQFAKIKAKIAEIDGAPVTYPIYIERYRDWMYPKPHPAPWVPYWGNTSGFALSAGNSSYAQNHGDKGTSVTEPFDSLAAMNALGRAEAMN